mgnify:FL=1
MSKNVYAIPVQKPGGQSTDLSEHKGKVLLIVNVASKCGLTPQYEGLQKLHDQFHDKGLEILGFPCNQFGAQEPGKAAEIQEFCDLNFKVKFPLYAKIDVNGDGTHPLYQYLKKEAPGLLGSESIKWNFTKFLVARDGKVLGRVAPTDTPESMVPAIEKAL